MLFTAVHDQADVVLAPGVTVEAGCLRDASGRRHPVDESGELIARNCREPVAAVHLAAALELISRAPAAEVMHGTERFIIELQGRRLLSVHQSFLVEMWRGVAMWPFDLVAVILLRKMPLKRFSSRRIYPASTINLVRAVLESYLFLPLITVVGAGAAVVSMAVVHPLVLRLEIDRAAILGLVAASACTAVLTTAFVHELGHLTAARIVRVPVLGVQARRGAASVVLAPRALFSPWTVLAAGPLAGVVFSAFLAGALVISSGAQLDGVRLGLVVVAVLLILAQLLSLTPLSADGKALRSAFRTAKGARRADS